VTTFWSAWIIILTSVTIAGTAWLLFANRKTRTSEDGLTTGHVYDGIEELENPLPAWWFYMFVASIVFGIGYLIAYPGMGNFQGLLQWTSAGQHEREVAAAE
jgi:cytochrome c oxidase cbb3-type subunit III